MIMIRITDTLTNETKQFKTLSRCCTYMNLDYNLSIKNVPKNGALFKERYLIDMSEYDFGTLYIFDYNRNSITTFNGKISELTKLYKISSKTIYKSINNKELIRNFLAFSYDKSDFGKHKPKIKVLTKQKDDMSVNGDFIKPEPKRKIVRRGKLGIELIKQKLKSNG